MEIIKLDENFLLENKLATAEKIKSSIKDNLRSTVGKNSKDYKYIHENKDSMIAYYNDELNKLVKALDKVANEQYKAVEDLYNISKFIHQIKEEHCPNPTDFIAKVQAYGHQACEKWHDLFKVIYAKITQGTDDPKQTAIDLNNWHSNCKARDREEIEKEATSKIKDEYKKIYDELKETINKRKQEYMKNFLFLIDYVINNQFELGLQFLKEEDSLLTFCKKMKELVSDKPINCSEDTLSLGVADLPLCTLMAGQDETLISKMNTTSYKDLKFFSNIDALNNVRIENFVIRLSKLSQENIKSYIESYSDQDYRKTKLSKELRNMIDQISKIDERKLMSTLINNYQINRKWAEILLQTINKFTLLKNPSQKKGAFTSDQIKAANVIIKPLYNKKYDNSLRAIYRHNGQDESADIMAKLITIFYENINKPKKAVKTMLETFEKTHPDENYKKHLNLISTVIENIEDISSHPISLDNIANSNVRKKFSRKYSQQLKALIDFKEILVSIKDNNNGQTSKIQNLNWDDLKNLLKGNWQNTSTGPRFVHDKAENNNILSALDTLKKLGLDKKLDNNKIKLAHEKIFSEVYAEIKEEKIKENKELKKKK